MRELYARMAELEREGRPFAVATVVRTVGSTPQVVGAKMLVDDLGRTHGTLGGGCVEGDAFAEAKRILDEGGSSLREYELTEELAWDTGLVCGGTMWIHIVPPQTRPVSQASSSVSSYSRSDEPPSSRIRFASANASPSTQPPPSVPCVRPRSSTSILAPTTCGVEPTVRTTVATANGRPSRSSSAMRA